jgi:hypothetical protein
MSQPAQPLGGYASAGDALAAVQAGLAFLARTDAAALPAGVLADCLRGLGAAESVHIAARSRILAAFTAQSAYEDDGCRSPVSWLAWQARMTRDAAAGAVGWTRRLAAHPRIGAALAAGEISESYARKVAAWSGRLPEDKRQDADEILLAAHRGGADLADLAGLADEMLRRCAPPDADDDHGFTDRSVQLDLHYRGAGKLDGNLTPECAAAFTAMLEALARKAGPEDDRTQAQRNHDALEEALRRLIGSGWLPDAAGQPTLVQLHMTLDQLRSLDGAASAEAAWAAGRAAPDGQPGWPASRKAAEAYACDALIQPIVTGHVDPAALAAMTDSYLAGPSRPICTCGRCTCRPGTGSPEAARLVPAGPGSVGLGFARLVPAGLGSAGPGSPGAGTGRPLSPGSMRRLQNTLLHYAADVLSGSAGLASFLRTGLLAAEFPPSVSLPLDIGKVTHTVPPPMRRGVIARDRHCAAPGCRQRARACQVHHIIPRSQGGATALGNLILLCPFHHLIAIHRWGWTISLATLSIGTTGHAS